MKKLVSWLLILAMLMMGGVALAQGTNNTAATEEEDDGWYPVNPIVLPLLDLTANQVMSSVENRAMFTAIAATELGICDIFNYEIDFVSPTFVGNLEGIIVLYLEATPAVPEEGEVVATTVPEITKAPVIEGVTDDNENMGIMILYSPDTKEMEFTVAPYSGRVFAEYMMEGMCPGAWYENELIDIYNALMELADIFASL